MQHYDCVCKSRHDTPTCHSLVLYSHTLLFPSLHSTTRLANIFNLTPSTSPSRFSIFLQLVTYTSTTSQLDLLLPYIKEADKWVKEWNLSQDQARQLFRALFDALDAAGKRCVTITAAAALCVCVTGGLGA